MERATRSPRAQIAQAVLEAAMNNRDRNMIAICRRVLEADRLGWRKHGDKADARLVYEFYESTYMDGD